MRQYILPKHGYWDTTHYPIGGSFRRAGPDGIGIVGRKRDIDPPYKGCDIEVYLEDGTTAAIKRQYVGVE